MENNLTTLLDLAFSAKEHFETVVKSLDLELQTQANATNDVEALEELARRCALVSPKASRRIFEKALRIMEGDDHGSNQDANQPRQ